jgi:formyl-CoA transferase
MGPAPDPTGAAFYREARSDLPGPLAGLRVLDVTRVWSGPMATCVLADLGADVVRVELPGNREGELPPEIPGTGLSWFNQTVHRNKRSVGLDLRLPDDRETFRALVADTDVLVENYRPGTLAGWGLGYPECRAVRPDLVYVSISGWGQFGPGADRPGYDPVVQAASGWMSLNGNPDGTPVRAPTFLADDIAGLHGAIGALAALRHRDATGEGQHVDVSMLDALLFQSSGLLTLGATGAPLRRWGDQTEFIAPANGYSCADGRIYLAVATNRQWRSLAAVLDRPELARAPGWRTNAERLANRAAVDELVAGWCAGRPAAEVVAAFEAAGLTVSPVRTFGEAAADPHVLARGMLPRVALANRSVAPLTGPAVKFSRTPTTVRRPAPVPGAHTADVLAEVAARTVVSNAAPGGGT